MTTRAEEIAGDGPYTVRYDNGRYVLDGPTPTVGFWALEEWDAQNHADDLNAAYKQGQQDRWIPIAEGTPSGHVWLTGHAYNDPRTGDYWQKPGYYHEGSLYADDDFDPWDGYPPTHWIPALPSPPNPEQQ